MKSRFLLIAGFAESVLEFRGALIRDIVDSGIEVHVAVPGLKKDSSARSKLVDAGVEVHDIPLSRAGTNPFSDLRLLFSVISLMRKMRPEFVLGYTIKPVIFGSLAAWFTRVPHRYALVTGLGFAFTSDRRGIVTAMVRKLYRTALRKTHKVFFQNCDDQALFKELGILTANTPSLVVNGSGVDLSRFARCPVSTDSMRFLMIARLLGDKGVREYADAAQEIRKTDPTASFGLAGWIDENPDSISKTELNGWVKSGEVEFLGKLDDVRPVIKDSTVYVLPSYREGTPRTVLEAMAMGRPVITTDAPGCRETVIDGENGFLVPVKSVDALVEAMQRFIDDPTLAARMGRRSREIAEEKYDVHKVNAVMLREMGIT